MESQGTPKFEKKVISLGKADTVLEKVYLPFVIKVQDNLYSETTQGK